MGALVHRVAAWDGVALLGLPGLVRAAEDFEYGAEALGQGRRVVLLPGIGGHAPILTEPPVLAAMQAFPEPVI